MLGQFAVDNEIDRSQKEAEMVGRAVRLAIARVDMYLTVRNLRAILFFQKDQPEYFGAMYAHDSLKTKVPNFGRNENKTGKIIPRTTVGKPRPEKNSAKCSIRSAEIPNPRQTSIDQNKQTTASLRGLRPTLA